MLLRLSPKTKRPKVKAAPIVLPPICTSFRIEWWTVLGLMSSFKRRHQKREMTATSWRPISKRQMELEIKRHEQNRLKLSLEQPLSKTCLYMH